MWKQNYSTVTELPWTVFLQLFIFVKNLFFLRSVLWFLLHLFVLQKFYLTPSFELLLQSKCMKLNQLNKYNISLVFYKISCLAYYLCILQRKPHIQHQTKQKPARWIRANKLWVVWFDWLWWLSSSLYYIFRYSGFSSGRKFVGLLDEQE